MRRRANLYVLPPLLAACALLAPPRAAACECVNHSVAGAKRLSKAVFLGTVLERDGDWVARVAVEKLWKGENVPEYRVHPGPGLCSAGLDVGRTYLVYAYWDDEKDRLATDVCTRTRPALYTDDMRKLGKPKVTRSVRNANQ